ncbi:glycerate kinase family protein [Crassaminicella profunda]|uniref:glycerate kinase family protein n=1 Tax=Crassaminicella profunda TaxID=1286698 RepID=UPI001CA71452|nr:glycerate kinase [Crassaminicella profunda]QZY54425.1 glycerate kinase [Crassaminicella profunda]
MKKIVISPDSFKGTMDSIEVCNIIEKGIKNIIQNVKVIKIPIADGGEGTVDAFIHAVGGEKVKVKVKGPLWDEIEAFYGILSDGETAVIEMASASGLPLVEDRKNPMLTTTYGTGQLMMHALNQGCKKIIIGIGGSATNDGGIGMATALGAKFLDDMGNEIDLNGGGLKNLEKIDVSGITNKLQNCEVVAACDVDNPLFGLNGAAYVFSPQKGADEKMVKELDENLRNFAGILYRDLDIDVQNIQGSGAAGGLGAGLVAFAGAKLQSGIKIILDIVKFDEIILDADFVITGEGRIDGQSLRGKVPIGIAEKAVKYNVPVIAIVGAIGIDAEKVFEKGITSIFTTNLRPEPFEEAKKNCKENLLKTTEAIMRLIHVI